jgi:hypothetical protein
MPHLKLLIAIMLSQTHMFAFWLLYIQNFLGLLLNMQISPPKSKTHFTLGIEAKVKTQTPAIHWNESQGLYTRSQGQTKIS